MSLGFYLVKTTSIFLISALYFVVGSILSILLNDLIPDKNLKEISTIHLTVLLGVIFGSIGVVFYALRILIKNMPFFLDGYYGFKYSILREAAGGIIIGYAMYAFLDKLKILMNEWADRFRKKEVDIKNTIHSI